MTKDLAGKKLVVTGAARGIGEQVARLAAGRGAQVALIGLEPERAVVFTGATRTVSSVTPRSVGSRKAGKPFPR